MERAFIRAFLQCREPTRAAIAAGYPAKSATHIGVSLLGYMGIFEAIASKMSRPDRIEFEKIWPIDLPGTSEESPTLAERIQAQREAIAYASRGPEPAELVIERRTTRRDRQRAARALKAQKEASPC